MKNVNMQEQDIFSLEKLKGGSRAPTMGGKTSSLMMLSGHLPPEELAILARIVATNTPSVLDEVPPFSQEVLDQLQQMHR